jgi:hypothetical protein
MPILQTTCFHIPEYSNCHDIVALQNNWTDVTVKQLCSCTEFYSINRGRRATGMSNFLSVIKWRGLGEQVNLITHLYCVRLLKCRIFVFCNQVVICLEFMTLHCFMEAQKASWVLNTYCRSHSFLMTVLICVVSICELLTYVFQIQLFSQWPEGWHSWFWAATCFKASS